jgi:hypothetical protein
MRTDRFQVFCGWGIGRYFKKAYKHPNHRKSLPKNTFSKSEDNWLRYYNENANE